jgi:hypothetical protein
VPLKNLLKSLTKAKKKIILEKNIIELIFSNFKGKKCFHRRKKILEIKTIISTKLIYLGLF